MTGRRTAELALPEPESVTLSQLRTELVPLVRAVRARIRESGDVGAARELARRLEAYSRYLTDRKSRDLVAAETRRTEVLIGELLGPAPMPGVDVGSSRVTRVTRRRGLAYTCDRCGAGPGQACRTAAGRPAATQHVNRIYKAWQSLGIQLPDSRKALR